VSCGWNKEKYLSCQGLLARRHAHSDWMIYPFEEKPLKRQIQTDRKP
jgi:hypothetical protein